MERKGGKEKGKREEKKGEERKKAKGEMRKERGKETEGKVCVSKKVQQRASGRRPTLCWLGDGHGLSIFWWSLRRFLAALGERASGALSGLAPFGCVQVRVQTRVCSNGFSRCDRFFLV